MTADKPFRRLPATLIPGDGIGPEIVNSAVDILEALGSPCGYTAPRTAASRRRDEAMVLVL